tara:strand:- start:768 stop:1247 length:480 start_codon:yes stop_codon:yes gene_type:complete
MIWVSSILVIVLLGFFLGASYKLRLARKQEAINYTLYLELEKLQAQAQAAIKKNTRLIADAKSLLNKEKNSEVLGAVQVPESFDDPGMLATVITTIVAKNGNMRLSLSDFDNVKEGAYVSVYIDTATQDLILSLKHDLASLDSYLMAGHAGSETDDTYH